MMALVDAAGAPDSPVDIVIVFSNRMDALGLDYARRNGIDTFALSHKAFNLRQDFDQAVSDELTARKIDLVCLAGYMRLLSDAFCQQWQGRMINMHPSLLPAFKGLDTHQRVLDAGETEHGCSVHFVTPLLDDGPIILQAKVPVFVSDTAETLAARVLVEEHRIYPLALAMVARGEAVFQ